MRRSNVKPYWVQRIGVLVIPGVWMGQWEQFLFRHINYSLSLHKGRIIIKTGERERAKGSLSISIFFCNLRFLRQFYTHKVLCINFLSQLQSAITLSFIAVTSVSLPISSLSCPVNYTAMHKHFIHTHACIVRVLGITDWLRRLDV